MKKTHDLNLRDLFEKIINNTWVKLIAIIVGFGGIIIYFINLENRLSNAEKLIENYEVDILRRKNVAIAEIEKIYNSRSYQDSLAKRIRKEVGLDLKPFFGASIPGSTNWISTSQEVWINNELKRIPCIYLDVDLSPFELSEDPMIFWSLYGYRNHFEANGINAVYNVNQKSFRIFITYRDGVNSNQANSWGWNIKYVVFSKDGK